MQDLMGVWVIMLGRGIFGFFTTVHLLSHLNIQSILVWENISKLHHFFLLFTGVGLCHSNFSSSSLYIYKSLNIIKIKCFFTTVHLLSHLNTQSTLVWENISKLIINY